MKKIKLLSYLLVTVLCVGFTSCSSDDDNSGNGSDNQKRLVASRYSTGYETNAFYNSDNQLIKLTVKEQDGSSYYEEIYTFDYEKGIIHEERKYDGQKERDRTITFTLNKQGYISYISYSPEENVTCTREFTYDSNGYLTKMKEIDKDGSYTKEETTILSYKNGNLIKSTLTESNGFWDIRTYEYNNEVNKSGIFPLTPYFGICDDECDILYQTGIMGKQSKNHLISVSSEESDGYKSNYSFTYQLDNDGYIKTCIADEDGEKEIWNYSYK